MLERKLVEDIIGKGFADKLDEECFSLGKTSVSRRIMVEEMGCANFVAAIRLAKVLKKLDIQTPAELFKTDPFSIARVRGIGEAALFVAMCILESAGHDIRIWWGWKNTNKAKFSTFKHQATKRASKRNQDI